MPRSPRPGARRPSTGDEAARTQRIPQQSGQPTERVPRPRPGQPPRRSSDWRDEADLRASTPSRGFAGQDDRDGRDQGYWDEYDDRDHRRTVSSRGQREFRGEPRPQRAAGGGRGGPPRRPAPPAAPPRRRRKGFGLRRFVALVALLLIAYLTSLIVVAVLVWGSVGRVDATPEASDRPTGGSGSNYLLVGTDSREQLSEEQRRDFGTGAAEGHRADTVMLLHVPSFGGEPTLVSLPRDSYVEIRDNGFNKLNAAHAFGGPALLVDTVEQATGLRIDGYMEMGFGGFVGVVDKVGGVNMCLDAPVQDDKAHIDLPAGCQDLEGRDALGYVRMRYNDNRGDIGRVERQREFLSALVKEMASPATVLNPFRLHSIGTATGEAISLGDDTSMLEAARMALAMRSVANGQGHSLTVPVENNNYSTPVGSSVLWNETQAAELFDALRTGASLTIEP